MRNFIFHKLAVSVWNLCTWLSPQQTWYDGKSGIKETWAEYAYVLSGALEVAANGDKFKWPTDWTI